MKKFLVCFTLFMGTLLCIQAQSNIIKPALLVKEAKKTQTPKNVDLFTLNTDRNDQDVPAQITQYTMLTVNKTGVEQLLKSKSKLISLTLPQSGRNAITLELVEVNPLAEDFILREAPSMNILEFNTGKHFRGIISGQDKSVAAISVFNDQIMGFIAHPFATGNIVLGKMKNSPTHILYQDDQIAAQNTFECQAKDNEFEYTAEQLRGIQNGSRSLTDCTRLYLEVDYDIYVNKGSSVPNVNSYVTGLFNQVSTLYANEQINTLVSEILVWTQASPYNSTSSIGMLNAFTAYRQGFNGDLAQLLSYKASGGVAYVDGLCRTNPDFSMSYAGISSTYQNVPTYSWTVEVCTHEFGHLFGSQHTHACVWNGNNTAIDGCYTTEGGCPNPGIPSPSVGGTIMSYCHLTGAGINFSNGFGTQPGNIIRSEVTVAPCLQACSGGGGGGGGGGGNPCTSNTLTLEVKTDNYPSETTWNIKNSVGTILYSGGPYSAPNTLNTISLCLPSACYTFTINDSYGDGICCAYGNGFYNIKQGSVTLITGGTFGSTETKSFCATSAPGASCTDGIQNGQETGIDCGGPTCPACPTCSDGIQNGTETGVDCGGTTCPACATCNDGIQNGGETGIDCGGPVCSACPTCTDGIQNGTETGIDCGGNCAPCQNNGNTQVTNLAGHYFESGMDGWADGGVDCARVSTSYSPEGAFSIQLRDNEGEFSSMSSSTFNLSQYDSVTVEFKFRAVSFETGEDFWLRYFNGSVWTTVGTYVTPANFSNNIVYTRKVKVAAPLSANAKFRFQTDAGDNTDQIYIDAVIIKGYKTTSNSSCTDGIQNGQETGVDCGGPTCPACPTCSDGIQNGNETGVDCGGSCPACPTCNDGIQNGNETGIDCGGSCQPCSAPASCTDGIQNGQETGIDCGGPTCPACPTCSDGIQNGTETGIDCGGSCPPCNNGGNFVVLSGHYFETGWDGWIDGGSDCFRYQGSLSPEGTYSIRLRDNSAEQSAMTSPYYNLTTYNTSQIEFKFRTVSMETGESILVQYFNGTAWSTVATLVSGTNFNNNQLYTSIVTVTGPLSSAARFRFMCNASENDDEVYIDAVIIRAGTGTGIFENNAVIREEVSPLFRYDQLAGVRLFPNPANEVVRVEANEEVLKISIYNTRGELIVLHKSDQINSVDISALPAGMYFVRMETEENVYTERLIKN